MIKSQPTVNQIMQYANYVRCVHTFNTYILLQRIEQSNSISESKAIPDQSEIVMSNYIEMGGFHFKW